MIPTRPPIKPTGGGDSSNFIHIEPGYHGPVALIVLGCIFVIVILTLAFAGTSTGACIVEALWMTP